MCSKDDFYSWSDIDLDEILVNYTDNDHGDMNNKESTSGSDVYETEKPRCSTGSTKRAKDVDFVFDCPVCQKVLRSVSGFRGHVIKQHPSLDRNHFKVANHRRRCDVTGGCSSAVSTSAPEATAAADIRKPATLALTEADFHNLLIENTLKAWRAISVSPLFSLPKSKQGPVITDIAKSMIINSDTIGNFAVIENKLRTVFVDMHLGTHSDRDMLITKVHDLRMSVEVQGEFVEYISTQIPFAERESCIVLYQIWLRKFVAEMMNSMAHICTPADDAHVVPKGLSATDQNVLYHISGYMIMKLKSFSFRSKKLKSAEMIINHVAAKVPKHSDHFVKEYTKWVSKQSRGGLLYPIPDFYLLIREFDNVYREVVTTRLTSESLNKTLLQIAVHDSFMVKYYWNRILEVAGCDEHSSLDVIDYLISLFLTVKGFAVAIKERDSHLMKKGKTKRKLDKKSKSLRGTLKGAK